MVCWLLFLNWLYGFWAPDRQVGVVKYSVVHIWKIHVYTPQKSLALWVLSQINGQSPIRVKKWTYHSPKGSYRLFRRKKTWHYVLFGKILRDYLVNWLPDSHAHPRLPARQEREKLLRTCLLYLQPPWASIVMTLMRLTFWSSLEHPLLYWA